MFKIGQKVKIRSWQGSIELSNIIYVIDCITNNRIYLNLQNKSDALKGAKLSFDITKDRERYLMSINPICPVCNEEVEIEDKKVKKHNHNNQLCYGSYTPYV